MSGTQLPNNTLAFSSEFHKLIHEPLLTGESGGKLTLDLLYTVLSRFRDNSRGIGPFSKSIMMIQDEVIKRDTEKAFVSLTPPIWKHRKKPVGSALGGVFHGCLIALHYRDKLKMVCYMSAIFQVGKEIHPKPPWMLRKKKWIS